MIGPFPSRGALDDIVRVRARSRATGDLPAFKTWYHTSIFKKTKPDDWQRHLLSLRLSEGFKCVLKLVDLIDFFDGHQSNFFSALASFELELISDVEQNGSCSDSDKDAE